MPDKKEKLNSGHYHEVMDRSYVIMSNMEDFLLNHPAVSQNKKLKEKVEKAQTLLAEVYQEMGQHM